MFNWKELNVSTCPEITLARSEDTD